MRRNGKEKVFNKLKPNYRAETPCNLREKLRA